MPWIVMLMMLALPVGASEQGGPDTADDAVAAWIAAIQQADLDAVIATVDIDRLAAPLGRQLFGAGGGSFADTVSGNMRQHLRRAVVEMIRDDWLDNPRVPGAIRQCRHDDGRPVGEQEYLYRLECLRQDGRRAELLKVRQTNAGWKVFPLSGDS